MLLHDQLLATADRYPEKAALVHGDKRLTYSEFHHASSSFAAALNDAGVARGNRVVIYLPNSIDAAICIYGTLMAGAVFVPANPNMKARKLSYLANDCRAVALITDRSGMRTVASKDCELPTVKTVLVTEEVDTSDVETVLYYPSAVQPPDAPGLVNSSVIDKDLACLIYTSGSTGHPKGVVCGHDNVSFAVDSIISYLENSPQDIVVNVLPFAFDYGLYQLLMTVRFGGTLVIENAFGFPTAILRTIERERVSGFPIVPTLLAMMLTLDLSRYDLSSLRYLTNTAAALPPRHIELLHEQLPKVRIYSMYGMTECKRTLYLPPERLADKPSSVGIPIPGTEVWIEDETGLRCAPGAVGELVVRGQHVMRGYWEDQELTSKTYRPGPTPGERVLYTGDLFRSDAEGFLYFVARKDDLFKSRGEKIYPKEVENVICELAGVAEAAVVGVDHPVIGKAVKAFVVATDHQLDDRAVLRHCSAKLEGYMVPSEIEFRTELPRSSNGKVDKRQLAMASA